MEHLNLFGVPLSEVDQLDFGKDQEETVKENNYSRRFVRELIDVM